MFKRDIHLYLKDIEDSVLKIESYTENISFNDFVSDDKTIDAVIRNLLIIGEAINNIPYEIQEKYPDIPWGEIVGMRNKVVHEYFGIDKEIIWQTIKNDLPLFKEKISEYFMIF